MSVPRRLRSRYGAGARPGMRASLQVALPRAWRPIEPPMSLQGKATCTGYCCGPGLGFGDFPRHLSRGVNRCPRFAISSHRRQEINKAGESPLFSAPNNPQQAPQMTPPKREGDILSFPFASTLCAKQPGHCGGRYESTVNQVARARPASSVSTDPVRLGKNRTRGVVQKRRTSCDPVG